VFDPKDGRLKQLDINWEEYLGDLRDVYEMYSDVDELGPPTDNYPQEVIEALKNFFSIG
jgi:hypothetical protein